MFTVKRTDPDGTETVTSLTETSQAAWIEMMGAIDIARMEFVDTLGDSASIADILLAERPYDLAVESGLETPWTGPGEIIVTDGPTFSVIEEAAVPA